MIDPELISHEIRMTHAQCVLIQTALEQCRLQGYFGAKTSDRHEIDSLTEMFANLPVEHDADTMTHGFAL